MSGKTEKLRTNDWKARLIVSDRGKPLALLANAIAAFRDSPEWRGLLLFDAFHLRTVIRGKSPWMAEPIDGDWKSEDDLFAAEWLQHQGIHVSPDVAGQAVEAVARERRFHPVLEYLGRCVWDDVPRLSGWAARYLGADDTPYTRAVGPRWMISGIARVYEPGCKADSALILEGPQGLLKSTALKTLGHPWFTDELADLGTKDAALQIAGAWIVELSELESISRSDASKVKAFMSRTTDRFRPPYGRRVIEVPRQCIFAGTVNLDEYLRDETGNRRFWPIACSKIDIPGLVADRDQLWAEAHERYLAGEKWWLDTAELGDEARKQQQARYQSDAWEEPIRKWLRLYNDVSVAEVLRGAINLTTDRWSQTDMNRVARCLRALGWRRRQFRVGKDREWRYVRPPAASPDCAV